MKKFKIISITIALTFLMNITSYAGTWVNQSGEWFYDNGDGTNLSSGWYWVDGNYDGIAECYYFDFYGKMASNCEIDGQRVNENGALVIDGVVQTRSSKVARFEEIKQYITEKKWTCILGDDVVDCGNYYEINKVTFVSWNGLGEGVDEDVDFKLFLSKDADIQFFRREDWIEHYTPREYIGPDAYHIAFRFWNGEELKFDSNGWIIGAIDYDAG